VSGSGLVIGSGSDRGVRRPVVAPAHYGHYRRHRPPTNRREQIGEQPIREQHVSPRMQERVGGSTSSQKPLTGSNRSNCCEAIPNATNEIYP
jgi:hypothetical protein